MPATVATLKRVLGGYVRPDESFVDLLNQVVPRLAALGLWRDLLWQHVITTSVKYITLPWDASTIIAAMVEGRPVQLSPMWRDFQAVGGDSASPSAVFGLIDDGVHVSMEDLDGETPYQLSVAPLSPPTDSLPYDGYIVVEYLNEDGDLKSVSLELSSDGTATSTLTTPDRVVEIRKIIFRYVNDVVRVSAVPVSGDSVVVAEGRGDMVTAFRRYRLGVPAGVTAKVQLLLKRDTPPVWRDSDIVYLSDLNVVKHGLLACVAEDNADLQRASYHWDVCKQLLTDQETSARGMVKLYVKPDTSGGSGYNIPNLL